MTRHWIVLLLQLLYYLPAYGASSEDCEAKCCVQTALGEVCAPVCQQECQAQGQANPAQLPLGDTPFANPAPLADPVELEASAVSAPVDDGGGMLLPGWQAIAEQALGDLRAVVMQIHPDAATAPVLDGSIAPVQPIIDGFMAGAGSSPSSASDPSTLPRLVDTVWQASASEQAADEGAAQRLARNYTFASAIAQLARSVYGGPAGGAAYATWWAYRQPGANPAQALRVGLLVGAGMWDTQKGSDGKGVSLQISQGTSLAAALGGLVVAAAGGDEQALRATFFDTGAAVLIADGQRSACLSATLDCQNPAPSAVLLRASKPTGWALDGLVPRAATDAIALPPPPPGPPQVPPLLAHAQGALPLDQGWRVSWQIAQTLQANTLTPWIVLSHGPSGGGTVTAASPTVLAADTQLPTTSRYICQRDGDTRLIWWVPGDPQAGYLCRAMYQVGDVQSVLWNALQNPQVCAVKAQARVELEESRGFQCRVAMQ